MAPVITKSLSRLSRDSLITLCQKWSQSENSVPYLASNRNLVETEEEDYLYEPAENVIALKSLYEDLKQQGNERDGLSKRDIVDRIVDGDWRRGLSLQQLADIDFANLEENDTALRWSALKLVPYETAADSSTSAHPAKKRKISHPPQQPHYPTISPANFVTSLKSHINPLVKAHYTLHQLSGPSKLAVLRLYIVPNTPFAPLSSNVPRNVRQATDSGRVMYIALPDSCPHIYVSLSGATGSTLASRSKNESTTAKANIDITATKRIILEAIPKALSKPQERWSLENTKLTCRSLKSIGLLRGNGRPGTAGGAYAKFSEEYEWKPDGLTKSSEIKSKSKPIRSKEVEPTPLTVTHKTSTSSSSLKTPSTLEAALTTRFGTMSNPSHAKLDRFHLTINNILAKAATSASTSESKSASSSESQSSSQPPSKRKRRSLEDIEAGRYSSPAPAPTTTSTSAPTSTSLPPNVSTNNTNQDQKAEITLTFNGTDVFQGLRKLALLDGGKYVDLERLPSWLTGEKGVSGLTI